MCALYHILRGLGLLFRMLSEKTLKKSSGGIEELLVPVSICNLFILKDPNFRG